MSDKQHKVLVIEDDEDTRALLEFILGRAGFNVYLAIDGQAAFDMIQTMEPPDIILMDILMPYHDGFEVLRIIKGKKDWKHVPVIMLTSKEDEDDIVKSFKLGISDYITKPFKPAELVVRIQKTLNVSV